MFHQRQGDVALNAVLQEIVVPRESPLSFHVRAHIRLARLHDFAHLVLADGYPGLEWLDVEVRRLALQHALKGLLPFALQTLDVQGVKLRVISVAHNDTDGVELNHGFKVVTKAASTSDKSRWAPMAFATWRITGALVPSV